MIDMTELPDEVLQYIVKLLREAAQYRDQRNKARAELAELRVEVGDRISERDSALQMMRDAEVMAEFAVEEVNALVSESGR